MSRRIRVHHNENYTYTTLSSSHPAPKNTIDLSYQVHGSGPQNLLFIPGMCVSSDMWQHQLDELQSNSQYTLCLIDNRGSGQSGIPRQAFTMTDMARDALAVANYIFGRRSKFHIIGHSMGGMIAQRLALIIANSGVERVSSLSLLSSHCGGWFWNSFPSLQLVAAGIDMLRTGFDERMYADVHMRLHYSEDFLNEMLICEETGEKVQRRCMYYSRYLRGIREEQKREGGDNVFWGHFLAIRTHFLSVDEALILRQASFPKMVIYGEKDGVVLPRASVELAKLIGGIAYQVGGAHFVMDEARHEINLLLRQNFVLGSRSDMDDCLVLPALDRRRVFREEPVVA